VVVLGIILARAGSKGLPDKCVRSLCGRPLITYTFGHALAARCLRGLVLTTDSVPAKNLASEAGIEVIDRPVDLAGDTATVDAAARHAVEVWERRSGIRAEAVVLLYGNIPVRAEGLIDRAVAKLRQSGADSVRSVAQVTKQHPDWIHRLDGDRMQQFRSNSIYRRQDLKPLYYHDGAVAAVTRSALFGALNIPDDHQAFLGRDRRAIIQSADAAVDVDEPIDLLVAEAVLRAGRTGASETSSRSLSSCARSDAVQIGDRPVGPRENVFVVAEAGVNHNGSVDTALRLIDTAVDAGADAVKFQMFRAAEIVGPEAPTAGYQHEGTGVSSQRALLESLELSQNDFVRLKRRCAERGILFLATPFSVLDVGRLVELEVCALKIASTDLTNLPLIRAAAATKKPLFLSTGASTMDEIGAAVAELRRLGVERLILLHCVSCYPTPMEAVNLHAIRTLEKKYAVPAGLSDHTASVQTGGWAVVAGACVIEKHFTVDPRMTGPDHAMSLSPAQFAEYVALIRAAQVARGDGELGMAECEAEVRRVAGRSVVAAVDIPEGTDLRPDMLTVKRPAGGIAPSKFDELMGRRTQRRIPRDAVLSWDMLR